MRHRFAEPLSLRRVLLLADVGAVAMLYTLWSARPLWSDVALLGVLAVAVAVTWKGLGAACPRPLCLPGLAFSGAFALSAALAPDPYTAWRTVLGVAAYGLLFMLFGNLLAQGVTRRELYHALVLRAQVIVVALAVSWLLDGAPLVGYRLRFENANSAALAVMLLMPALLVGEARWLVAGESAALLWLSASRAGALGLAGGVATLLLRGQRRRWAWLALPSGGLGALAVGLRPDWWSGNAREALWAVALRMAAASPLVGQGPSAFKAWWLATDPPLFFFGHAHSLYLNLLAETGLVGVAAGAWLAGALLQALWRRASSPWALAALAATVALLAHSLGDVPTTAPYITVTWLALVRLGLAETAP